METDLIDIGEVRIRKADDDTLAISVDNGSATSYLSRAEVSVLREVLKRWLDFGAVNEPTIEQMRDASQGKR